jgi:protein involved in polysaccharide export with SLBB domain
LLQQRLNVREQEINGLKVQNRHLLSQIEELEKQAKPNQIDTQFVADEVRKHLDPVIKQLTTTMTSSFEILQSTMRGIYQQSQRSQKAVEDMAAHTRDLEIRLNDQRKQDQNFYQDRIFSMIGNFCDRLERQIEIRLKALGTVEIMSSKQNEILGELESLKSSIQSVQKNSESNRGDVIRVERNSNEVNQKLVDVQVQTQNSEELIRDTLQQVQNHRAEFKLIRSELKQAVDSMNVLLSKVDESRARLDEPQDMRSEEQLIHDLVEQKQKEIDGFEKSISRQVQGKTEEDATMILSLLRAQKDELQRVAENAKTYIQENVMGLVDRPQVQAELNANPVEEKGQ